MNQCKVSSMIDTLFDERRLTSRVLRHWEEMAIGRRLPSRESIDPWLIGDDWSHCFLVSLDSDLQNSMFLAVGNDLLPSPETALDFKPVSEWPRGTLIAAM